MTLIRKLNDAITAVCPIDGISIARLDDRSTWRIDFKNEATPTQRAAAQSVVQSFDVFAAQNPTADERGAEAVDAMDRLQLEDLFILENRVRALEGLASITSAQYRQALINRWKALNP